MAESTFPLVVGGTFVKSGLLLKAFGHRRESLARKGFWSLWLVRTLIRLRA